MGVVGGGRKCVKVVESGRRRDEVVEGSRRWMVVGRMSQEVVGGGWR